MPKNEPKVVEDEDRRIEREPGHVFRFNVFAVILSTLVVAAIYWGISFYYAQAPFSKTRVRQVFTVNHICSIGVELKKYRSENKAFPKLLSDIPNKNELPLNDAWGNPLIYETDGEKWTIQSLGADGKPGGKGLNTDLVVTNKMFEQKTTQDAVFLLYQLTLP